MDCGIAAMVDFTMRSVFAIAAILLTAQTAAMANDVGGRHRKVHIQAGAQDPQLRKLQECRRTVNELIGLSIDAIRDRCGPLSNDRFVANEAGRFDVVSYGEIRSGAPYLVLYVDDGIVFEAEIR
jgi:hypothetical protein